MTDGAYSYSREVIDSAAKLLSDHFQKSVRFTRVVQLSEPDRRNLILRLIIDNRVTNVPKSFILKQTSIEKNVFDGAAPSETKQEQLSRFAHDWAGLALLTEIKSNHGPHFYAGNLEQKYILIEDLGEAHPSLVGPLTRESTAINVDEAVRALRHYIKRLGRMHADTIGTHDRYEAILNQVYPDALRFSFLPDDDVALIGKQLKRLMKYESDALIQEIQSIVDFSQNSNSFNVLLHGDICPDNVYYQNNDVQFIDFEWGDFGPALIDATYLRMHMPSCWCSKSVPMTVIHEMESIYRDELKKGIPEMGDDSIYNQHLVYACAYWLVRTLKQIDSLELLDKEWICPSGPIDSNSQWKPDENTFRPRILSRIESFIVCSETTGHLPELSKVSIQLLAYLKKTWPDTQLIDGFPVFKNAEVQTS